MRRPSALVPSHRVLPGPGVAGPLDSGTGPWSQGRGVFRPPEAELFPGHGRMWPTSPAMSAIWRECSVRSARVPAVPSSLWVPLDPFEKQNRRDAPFSDVLE